MADLKTLMEDIARAIRLKTGVSDKINAQDFPQKIREIETDGTNEQIKAIASEAEQINNNTNLNIKSSIKISLEDFNISIKGNYIDEKVSDRWIESSGTQYIDIGYIPNENTEFEITFSNCEFINPETVIFGAGRYSSNAYLLTREQGLSWYYGTYKKQISYNKEKTTMRFYRNRVIKDEQEIYSDISINQNTQGQSTTLFGVVVNGTPSKFAKYRLHSFKIYENGSILYNLIPKLSEEENHLNEPSMFDILSSQYFYNLGTGKLVYGEEKITTSPVNKELYIEEEFLNANNSTYQWIINNVDLLPIDGATSSRYIPTEPNKISCRITGKGDLVGEKTTNIIEVIEYANGINK